MTSTARERIEMRIDAESKSMAERASAALGCTSLTEFITRLIREHAPTILQEQATLQLTNAQFDRFLVACQGSKSPSSCLLSVAKTLDEEGY